MSLVPVSLALQTFIFKLSMSVSPAAGVLPNLQGHQRESIVHEALILMFQSWSVVMSLGLSDGKYSISDVPVN